MVDEYNKELCDERHKNVNEKLDHIIKKVDLLLKAEYGNDGQPGRKVEFDRLKQTVSNQKKIITYVCMLVLARFVWMAFAIMQEWISGLLF